MRGTILCAVLSAAALAGCYATGDVGYSATYSSNGDVYATPDLVTVSPGVQVVADYDEPVFYTDGFYWRYYDGLWYRSGNYAAGWVYVERPPYAVVRIERPYAYRHYRPTGYVARSRPSYRPQPIVRDHRTTTYRPEPVYRERREVVQPVPSRGPAPAARAPAPAARAPAPAAAPAGRDHRTPIRESDQRDHRH